MPAMLGMVLEQAAERFEALRQALGVVHAVDADGQRPAGKASLGPLHQLGRWRRGGTAAKPSASMPIGSTIACTSRSS